MMQKRQSTSYARSIIYCDYYMLICFALLIYFVNATSILHTYIGYSMIAVLFARILLTVLPRQNIENERDYLFFLQKLLGWMFCLGTLVICFIGAYSQTVWGLENGLDEYHIGFSYVMIGVISAHFATMLLYKDKTSNQDTPVDCLCYSDAK